MKQIIFTITLLFVFISAYAQQKENIAESKNNSISLGPMGDIFIAQYGRKITAKDEFIIGASYTNPDILKMIEYPGTEQIYTLELGYRRYLWRNLNVEIQLDPQYFQCVDLVENKEYNGFGLTPEVRFGYRFDFNVAQIPFFINLQWFAGYHLINPKPQSFQDIDGGSFYVSPIPMFFLGFKF